MTLNDSPKLSAAEIRSIEAHARQLRSEFMRDMFAAFGRNIVALTRKTASFFHRPHHA